MDKTITRIFEGIICLSCLFASCSKMDQAIIDTPDIPDPSEDTTSVAKVFPTVGEHRYLVILVETSDVHFSIPDPGQAFYDMLNKEGYSEYGGTGSVRDYFVNQSMSAFNPHFDVYGPVRVDMEMSNFIVGRGLTKLGAARLFAMACDKIDKDVDFSVYDSDSNGIIDDVFFYFAGYNSAEGPDNAIWPHAGVVEYKQWTFDGKQLVNYACTSELKGADGTEMARIGNFCHEFAHILGLPDFYDTKEGKAEGLGDFSLMHSGCYNNSGNTPPSLNCEERLILGWTDRIPVISAPTSGYKLSSIRGNNSCLIQTGNSGEYFYLEYRDAQSWDAFLPEGLAIYHVDKSENDVNGKTAEFRWRNQYDINGYSSHECFDLIHSSDTSIVFGDGVNRFTPISWSGEETGWTLENISFDGTTATFDVVAQN